MNAITRDIAVTRKNLYERIVVTKGTNMIPIVLNIIDFTIPLTASATAYVLGIGEAIPRKKLCNIEKNKIILNPTSDLFQHGTNVTQMRIIDGNKTLITFEVIVECKKTMEFGDADEEKQQTLIEQILAEYGVINGAVKVEKQERVRADQEEEVARKQADETERKERISADTEEALVRKSADETEWSERTAEDKKIKDEIEVERKRIDSIAKLEDGSTTGDAELVDMRIGHDGKEYDTAGAALRGQIGELKGELNNTLNSGGRLETIQESPLNDLNTFPANSIYELYSDGIINCLNKPTQSGDFATVITISGSKPPLVSGSKLQLYIVDNQVYKRISRSNRWTKWESDYSFLKSYGRLEEIQSEPLNDLDTFPANSIYELFKEAYQTIKNKPTEIGSFATIITISGYHPSDYATTKVQLFITQDNTCYRRVRYSSAWSNWDVSGSNIINVNSNSNTPLIFNDCIINGNNHIIDLGTKLETNSDETIKVIDYIAEPNSYVHKVFVSKELPLNDSTSPRSKGYYVTLFDESDNKLTPTLNSIPNKNEFTFRDNKFYINSDKKIFCLNYQKESYGLVLNNCTCYNLRVLHASKSCIKISGNTNCYNVEGSFSSLGEGFELYDANGEYENCVAKRNRNDGFNIHTSSGGSSSTSFKNCRGYNNYDDGISHHDNSIFVIDGGEYYGNVKGGVASPTHGAVGSIYNVYSHDNGYGIYALSDRNVGNIHINVFSCALRQNNVGIATNKYTINTFNVKNINSNNITDTGNIIEL